MPRKDAERRSAPRKRLRMCDDGPRDEDASFADDVDTMEVECPEKTPTNVPAHHAPWRSLASHHKTQGYDCRQAPMVVLPRDLLLHLTIAWCGANSSQVKTVQTICDPTIPPQPCACVTDGKNPVKQRASEDRTANPTQPDDVQISVDMSPTASSQGRPSRVKTPERYATVRRSARGT